MPEGCIVSGASADREPVAVRIQQAPSGVCHPSNEPDDLAVLVLDPAAIPITKLFHLVAHFYLSLLLFRLHWCLRWNLQLGFWVVWW